MRDLLRLHAALADETRLRLLGRLRHGETCVCQLQAMLAVSQPKISRHLAYLRRAGLVTARREGKWTYYSLKHPAGHRRKILTATLASLPATRRGGASAVC